MDVSERTSFLDSTKSQRSSTSMSAVVSMPSKPPQTAPEVSERQSQTVEDKPEQISGKGSEEEEGSKNKPDSQPQEKEAASADTQQEVAATAETHKGTDSA